MALPRAGRRLQPSRRNIHIRTQPKGLSRSCNIRLTHYLPRFRAFHSAPAPIPRPSPLLSAATHVLLRQLAASRDKSGVNSRTAVYSVFPASRESDSPQLTTYANAIARSLKESADIRSTSLDSASARIFVASFWHFIVSKRREPRNEVPDGSPDNPAAKYLRAISPLMARDRGAIEGVIYFAYFVPRSIPAAALSCRAIALANFMPRRLC